MSDYSIKEVLMRRDEMTESEADDLISQAKEDLQNRLANPADYDDPHDICADWFGLEPDYIFDLIDFI